MFLSDTATMTIKLAFYMPNYVTVMHIGAAPLHDDKIIFSRQVLTATLVTMQPISNNLKGPRQVRKVGFSGLITVHFTPLCITCMMKLNSSVDVLNLFSACPASATWRYNFRLTECT